MTLAEAYAYAYARTVGETAETRAGAQHPVYLYDLGGAGDVVLTELVAGARGAGLSRCGSRASTWSSTDRGKRDRRGGEAARRPAASCARARRLSGQEARGRHAAGRRASASADGPVEIADARLSRRPLSEDPQKGASGPRWSVLGTGGGQFFFDAAARNGLFPPRGTGGRGASVFATISATSWPGESISRWAAARRRCNLPGVAPIPEQFFELTGGASLWRDFDRRRFFHHFARRAGGVPLPRAQVRQPPRVGGTELLHPHSGAPDRVRPGASRSRWSGRGARRG